MAGDNTWVVEMQGKVNNAAAPSMSAGYIYRVPAWMKGTRRRSSAYEPQVVSLGPFHHGKEKLKPMEEHKTQAMVRLVRRSRKEVQDFVAAIDAVADELEQAYVGLDDKWRGAANRGKFVEMMTRDGCFLLESALGVYDGLVPGGTPGFRDDNRGPQALFVWESVRRDVVAIENQLPLLALKRLEIVRRRININVTDREINNLVLQFLKAPDDARAPQDLCLHPLDILHKCFSANTGAPTVAITGGPVRAPLRRGASAPANTGAPTVANTGAPSLAPPTRGAPAPANMSAPTVANTGAPALWENTMPCALELSQAGIIFKKSKTRKLNDIGFIEGFMCPVLHMPVFRVRYDTERYLLNLAAFEQLHPRAGLVITPYLFFMNNIISTRADVALLRSKGLIMNTLGSDEAVARLFNTAHTGLLGLGPSSGLHRVHRAVKAHCSRRCNWAKWRAKFVQTYMSDPLVLSSFLAAVYLLLLTTAQTVYAILSYHHPKR